MHRKVYIIAVDRLFDHKWWQKENSKKRIKRQRKIRMEWLFLYEKKKKMHTNSSFWLQCQWCNECFTTQFLNASSFYFYFFAIFFANNSHSPVAFVIVLLFAVIYSFSYLYDCQRLFMCTVLQSDNIGITYIRKLKIQKKRRTANDEKKNVI